MKIRFLLFPVLLLGCVLLLQRLLVPKYMTGIYEGNLIAEYYDEVKAHDVILIGDCEVYENISPMTLWEEYGITSFIRGSAQQLTWQSYYLLEETLRYEKPRVVVFSVLALKYNEPQNEAYNRLTLDGMKGSGSKLGSVMASMTKDEAWITYLLPILRYHDRWKELTAADWTYFWQRDRVSHNGFMMRCDSRPVSVVPVGPKLGSYQFGDNSYLYLDKITKLCKDNDIQLVLIKAPSLYPYWYEEWDEQMVRYAAENELLYINFLDLVDEIGLDFEVDTYDAGLHLNLSGAEKLSVYFGRILYERYGFADWRTDQATKLRWDEKRVYYDEMKKAQMRELEESGTVKTFLYRR